jgi:opacity protein-like surface antigen
MKNLNILVGAIAIAAVSPAAFANVDYFNDPYVGAEAIQTNQQFKNEFGKDGFKKNPLDLSVFGGFKFTKHFGLEAGWEQQLKKKKSLTVGGSVIIEDEEFSGTANVNTTVKGRHPYLGIFGEYKYDAWKFQAMLGASFSKVKATVAVDSISGVVPDQYVVGSTIGMTKSKVIPMVKLSALYNFTECFGVRVTGTYRNTSQLKLTTPVDSDMTIKLKDTFGLGLGVVYTFG